MFGQDYTQARPENHVSPPRLKTGWRHAALGATVSNVRGDSLRRIVQQHARDVGC
jgi:hypothetical protein